MSTRRFCATGLVMGFGAGAMLTAIACQLIPAGEPGSGSLLTGRPGHRPPLAAGTLAAA